MLLESSSDLTKHLIKVQNIDRHAWITHLRARGKSAKPHAKHRDPVRPKKETAWRALKHLGNVACGAESLLGFSFLPNWSLETWEASTNKATKTRRASQSKPGSPGTLLQEIRRRISPTMYGWDCLANLPQSPGFEHVARSRVCWAPCRHSSSAAPDGINAKTRGKPPIFGAPFSRKGALDTKNRGNQKGFWKQRTMAYTHAYQGVGLVGEVVGPIASCQPVQPWSQMHKSRSLKLLPLRRTGLYGNPTVCHINASIAFDLLCAGCASCYQAQNKREDSNCKALRLEGLKRLISWEKPLGNSMSTCFRWAVLRSPKQLSSLKASKNNSKAKGPDAWPSQLANSPFLYIDGTGLANSPFFSLHRWPWFL